MTGSVSGGQQRVVTPPLAAARGALELLGEAEAGPGQERLQGRALDAIVEMGDLVDAFLWFAREPDLGAAEVHGTALGEWVRGRLHRPGEEGPRLRLEDELEGVGPEVPEPLLRVILNSLLANAQRHGTGGEILVRLLPDGLEVENARDPRDAGAPGLGLEILIDLAARAGWTLDTEQLGARYRARLRL